MKTYLVSVVMPVYNLENYIFSSIQSILKQTYSNIELIIVDDCSTDNSYEIARTFKDERIRLFRNSENRGVVYSRNFAISKAKGVYIALNDGDDISHPRRIEYQVSYMEQHPDIGVLGTFAFIIDAEGKIRDDMRLYSNSDELKIVNMFTSPFLNSSTMSRSYLLRENPYSEEFVMGQDSELWLRLSAKTKFYTLKQRLLFYRVHNFNVQHRIDSDRKLKIRKLLFEERSKMFFDSADLHDKYIRLFIYNIQNERDKLLYINEFFSRLLQEKTKNLVPYYRVYYRKYMTLMLGYKHYKWIVYDFVTRKYPFLSFLYIFQDGIQLLSAKILTFYMRFIYNNLNRKFYI